MLDNATSLGSKISTIRQQQQARPTASTVSSNRQTFANMLGKIQTPKSTTDPAKIREVAEKYVAGSLVLPLLKQAREARDASPPFGMTDAEKQMGSLMDSHLATDMVKRGNWAIVDRITRNLTAAAEKSSASRLATPTDAQLTRTAL